MLNRVHSTRIDVQVPIKFHRHNTILVGEKFPHTGRGNTFAKTGKHPTRYYNELPHQALMKKPLLKDSATRGREKKRFIYSVIFTLSMKALKTYFNDWTIFEKIWLVTFTLTNIYLFYAWHDTLIGLTASLTGMICVVLVAKGKISNYYYGIPNVILYAYVAWQSKYYGEVMLNILYFLPIQFLGIYYWKKNIDKRKTRDDVIIRALSWKARTYWFIISAISVATYGAFLAYLGGTLPYVDSTSTVLSIIAMILMVQRATEQWYLWIVVDVVSVYMWFYVLAQGGNDISMLIMWTAYLVNAVYGLYNWHRMEYHDNRTHTRKIRTAA